MVRLLVPSTKSERIEVMVWQAQGGPQTMAVVRFIRARRLTYAAGLITREHGSLEEATRN
jgi:hypothetical protein